MKKLNKEPKDENGKPHGLWMIYFEGNLLFKEWNIHGIKHGNFTVFSDNGDIEYTHWFVYGKRHGLFIGLNSFFGEKSNSFYLKGREISDVYITLKNKIIY